MKDVANEINPIIQAAINAERIVGASVMIAQHGKIIFSSHAGWANRETKQPVSEQSIFRLASLTKPIVSAAALALIEKGKLALDTPVTHWLPNFTPKTTDGAIAKITLQHLLTHTAGLTYGFLFADSEPYHSAGVSDGLDEKVLSLTENLNRISKVPLLFAPGSAWCYSVATDVLGAILETACKQPLPEIIKTYVTDPLRMYDSTFQIENSPHLTRAYADNHNAGAAARIMQDHDQVLLEGCGPIRYTPGRILNSQAFASGGAGMAGTAKDYLIFLEAIRQGGQSILSTDSVKLMTSDLVPDFEVAAAGPGFGFGMGFAVVRDSQTANTPRRAGSFGWGGVYGASMFVDPALELSVVMISNTALHGLMGAFPVDITNALYKVLA